MPPLILIALLAGALGFILGATYRDHKRHFRTRSVGLTFSGESKMADLSLQIGQSSTSTLTPLLADGVTPTPGAVITSATWSLSDASISTVTNGNEITVTAVAETTNPVNGSVVVVVTDSDGTVGNFTVSFTVTVGGVPPVNRTASVGLAWSVPQ